jgi:hypothetical protein
LPKGDCFAARGQFAVVPVIHVVESYPKGKVERSAV